MSIHTHPDNPPPAPKGRRVNIEIVVPCVNYGDYLSQTLPAIMHLFDRVIVVTSGKDAETREVARRCSCECICTEAWYRDGSPFNKYAGVAHALAYLSVHNTWVGTIDADTWLPPLTRQVLESRFSRPGAEQCIYGVDRLLCFGWDRWRRLVNDQHPGHDYGCRVPAHSEMPLGDRISLRQHGGWLPIGYFQMWHASTNRRYPTRVQGDSEHNDVLHAMQWEPEHRILIPEVLAVHLMADRNAKLGANWKGRTTPRFGPRGS